MLDPAAYAADLQQHSLRALARVLARCAPGSWAMETTGIHASMVPVAPEQPLVNVVSYTSATQALAHADQVAALYRAAGVRSWAIWFPEGDRQVAAGLAAAGYRVGERLPAMILDLNAFTPLRLVEAGAGTLAPLDHDANGDMPTLGRINEISYPTGQGLEAAFAAWPPHTGVRVYQARVDGEIASVLVTIDHSTPSGRDCGVHFVATLPVARGRGLATQLLSAALLEARQRGCLTSTLQASPIGTPLYERLGYQTAFFYTTLVYPLTD